MSEATAAPRNTASELPPAERLWYAAAGVAEVYVVATDKACEFFKVLPPPVTVGRSGGHIFAYIRLGCTVWLDSRIPRDNLDLRLDLRLEDRPVLNPVHIMNLILLGRSVRRTFRTEPGSVLKIIPVY
jgi:hypothetical protein